jgi:hypothetical protein
MVSLAPPKCKFSYLRTLTFGDRIAHAYPRNATVDLGGNLPAHITEKQLRRVFLKGPELRPSRA